MYFYYISNKFNWFRAATDIRWRTKTTEYPVQSLFYIYNIIIIIIIIIGAVKPKFCLVNMSKISNIGILMFVYMQH